MTPRDQPNIEEHAGSLRVPQSECRAVPCDGLQLMNDRFHAPEIALGTSSLHWNVTGELQ